MTADNDNTIQSQGLYVWQADNLLAATVAVDGHWQANEGHADLENNVASTRIATDTRTIKAGDIFLALTGDNFDGHDYIELAASKGAVATIVSKPIASSHSIAQLVVNDTRLALGQLASYRRQQHKDLTVIAITGSSGKTTCKEMLGSIFGRLAPTLITRGNLNNDLGVPMMLLELSDHHRYAILELGANHIGEIAYTTEIVQPDVACILNIGTAHLGEFGSREGICQTKAEIFHTLNDSQFVIVPDKDDFTNQLRRIAEQHTSNVIGFGNTDDIAAVIPQLQGAVGRMQRVPSNNGCFIVDYAHTPDALSQVLASLKTHCKGQLWAVFGCGGDRDAGKRPLMAQAGLAGADQVILTVDNPRTEDPNTILQGMQAGMSTEQYQRTHIEPARQKAIEYAVNQAAIEDIVVIAGKGHETYQEINNIRYDFDDSVILHNALAQAGRI